MPTFKHPCPYCGKFIDKISAACPFCGQVDPFAPKRCQNCRKIVEDPAWVVCPACGASLVLPPPGVVAGDTTAGGANAAAGATQAAPPRPPVAASAQPEAAPVAAATGKCAGCGAPLPGGARFCTICGTMAG